MALIDQVMSTLGQRGGISEISRRLGTDEQKTRSAVGAAVPVLVSAFAREASLPDGAKRLDTAIERDHDGSALDDIPGTLSRAESGAGEGILRHVLGGRQEAAATGVGKASGLETGKASSLLAMLAPVVMGALGREKRSGRLDASGLASMLNTERQRASADSSMGGLLSFLDADRDGQIMDDIKARAGKLFGH